MAGLAVRAREAEWMDGDGVTDAEMAACLHDLAQVNTVTLGRRPTLGWLRRLLRGRRGPVTIVDVGSGQGDMLRAIAHRLPEWGVDARLIGYDLNPRCVSAARTACAGLPIAFVVGDATAEIRDADVILSALVTHHMADDELVRFLGWMEQTAGLGWFVNDLHRHRIAYHGFAALARIAAWHRFVRHDGPLSVRRAFTSEDWRRHLAAAQVTEARIEWWMPFRLCVAREKS